MLYINIYRKKREINQELSFTIYRHSSQLEEE